MRYVIIFITFKQDKITNIRFFKKELYDYGILRFICIEFLYLDLCLFIFIVNKEALNQ